MSTKCNQLLPQFFKETRLKLSIDATDILKMLVCLFETLKKIFFVKLIAFTNTDTVPVISNTR